MRYLVAWVIYLVCIANGGKCNFVADAHVTEYAPEMGGENCEEPCDQTAYMTPVIYGETAACGPNIPFGTQIYIQDVGWRICQDHGGAIEDDEVDVAVREEDLLKYGISGYHDVVWIFPQNEEAKD